MSFSLRILTWCGRALLIASQIVENLLPVNWSWRSEYYYLGEEGKLPREFQMID